MRIRLFVCFLLISWSVHAQKKLSGRVLISGTDKPVGAASVYLSTTSIGATTDDSGAFTLPRFPQGRYELVVVCVGYEPYHLQLSSDQLPRFLDIQLQPKAEELQEIILEPYDDDGWRKWGQVFLDNFIGTSSFASDCKLANRDVLRMRLAKKTNTVKVSATDQLIIENEALGYIVKYNLVRFEFNLDSKEFVYEGTAFFTEMKPSSERIAKRWIENRKAAYNGSLMHFMRSVYNDKLKEEKFEVREWITVSEEEKQRVKQNYTAYSKKVRKITVATNELGKTSVLHDTATLSKDTLAYFNSVMKQLEEEKVLVNLLQTGKGLTTQAGEGSAIFQFKDGIRVTYLPLRNPFAYQKYLRAENKYLPVVSDLFYSPGKPITVFANGNYFDGKNLITLGYWAWWEKICNKLPYDYN